MTSTTIDARMPISRGNDPFQERPKAVILAIAAAHVLLIWALAQSHVAHRALEAMPLMVAIIAPDAPRQESAPLPQPAKALPTPPLERFIPPPLVVPAEASVAQPVAEPVQAAEAVQAPQPAQPKAAAPVANQGPKMIPTSGIQYLVPPPIEYPRAARRLRQTGKAMVRVLIDEAGLPRTVELEKSAGFAALDEAAVAAVRKARFKPYIENGKPMAGWALIPLSFDLEN